MLLGVGALSCFDNFDAYSCIFVDFMVRCRFHAYRRILVAILGYQWTANGMGGGYPWTSMTGSNAMHV